MTRVARACSLRPQATRQKPTAKTSTRPQRQNLLAGPCSPHPAPTRAIMQQLSASGFCIQILRLAVAIPEAHYGW